MQPKNKTAPELLISYLRMPAGILLLCLLQIQWPRVLTFGEIKPNLLLILLFMEVLGRSPLYGAFWGFIMGLLLDVLSGAFWGLFALTYLLSGILGGWLKHWFYLRELKLKLGAFILLIVTYEGIFWGIYYYLYAAESWYRGIYRVLLPEAIYTFILGLAFLWLKSKINPAPISWETGTNL